MKVLDADPNVLLAVRSHWYAPHPPTRVACMDSAHRQARHAMHPQIVHAHGHGQPCNKLCDVIEPDWDAPTRLGSARERPVASGGTGAVAVDLPSHLLTDEEKWALRRSGNQGG